MPAAVLIISALVLVMLAIVLVRILKDSPDRGELARLRTREQDYLDTQEQLREAAGTIELLRSDNVRLETELENQQRSLEEKIRFLSEAEERLKTEFENLANRIFEDRGKVFSEKNRDGLKGLLEPFREQLDSFRQKVEQGEKESIARNASLIQEIRQLHELSNRVSEDASNLARAIKGDSKKQGDWGELIVERIFEASGLIEGRDYEKQASVRDGEGKLSRPDFVIHLPGKKDVIVDSKVSLTAFERFVNSDEESSCDVFLKQHLDSVRNHVKELQQKNYSGLLGSRSLDFVIMCIPLEPAYQAALQADPSIVYDLAGTNVVISGPTTLMITLKLIAQVWRRENQNRNAEEIADRAGRLYDQVALVADAMEESQKRLSGVSTSFELAMKRLRTGKGNLIGRVEEMRRLGAKVSKKIPESLLEGSGPEDSEEE